MKNNFRYLFFSILSILLTLNTYSEKYYGSAGKKHSKNIKSTAAGCLPGAGFKYLDLNNVRTRINTGGDMWWDFEDADYEIPKGSGKMSMFSASLWIGGMDVNNQLKLAALRYRQGPNFGGGNDYWPGPLTTDGTAAIDETVCSEYDKLFPITREEIDKYLAWWNDKESYPDYTIPQSILNWPAHGDISKGQSYYLAPFFDRGGDGDYDPTDGDYPYYDISGSLCKSKETTAEGNGILSDQVIKGDQTLWWVFNDKGNIHTETEGVPIGLEIRGQAFCFSTNDEVNNMTFYSYEIINRSTFELTNTFFSQWVDTDLGFAKDDYVGCDVLRGLGYCYNGLPVDGNGQAWAYGDQPPAIGVDFFQGPYLDPNGKDDPAFTGDCSIFDYTESDGVGAAAINGVNFGDGIKDNERFGMRRFVYHNNSGVADYMTDPDYAIQYYNFLRGIWKDNTKMQYGGNAHMNPGGAYGPECDFMFPGDSDPCNWGTKGNPPNGPVYWTEETAKNAPYDRRFMQSAGPFTLKAGAVNYITVGIPWARAVAGGPWASVELLRKVDDKCQALFDNCFQVLNGPNAPDLTIQELDKELIIYISNRKSNDKGNNFNERYKEKDPEIEAAGEDYDPYYRFEGYQIFQLKNANVSVADIHDPDLAREVFQCDIKNGITQIVNFNFDQNLGGNVPTQEVYGADEGIKHSVRIFFDAFTGERLVNHKQYYFLALAYAYNNFKTYDPLDPLALDGQQECYLAGRKNIKTYTGIPHIVVGKTAPQGNYGEGPMIRRIQGQGNGGIVLELEQESIDEILSKPPIDTIHEADTSYVTQLGDPNYPICYNPLYKKSHGPVNVKIIDPLNVKSSSYTLIMDTMFKQQCDLIYDTSKMDILSGKWMLKDNNTGKIYHSDTTIIYNNEQLFLDLGLSIQISQQLYPGDTLNGGAVTDDNGLLESSIEFADSTHKWLSGVMDDDNPHPQNWIRSGSQCEPQALQWNDWNIHLSSSATPTGHSYDPNGNYEKILNGTWAPYNLCAYETQDPTAPAKTSISKTKFQMSQLASVDVVITKDKSLWTRCPVVEMCPEKIRAEGNVEKYDKRQHKSVNVDGETDVVSDDPLYNSNYIDSIGMGWFPGYVINVETGERLNVMFGEDSWLSAENGRDMLWNPTPNVMSGLDYVFGGKHYLYVMAHTHNMWVQQGERIEEADCPAYDAGAWANKTLTAQGPIAAAIRRHYLYASCMWVNIPLSVKGEEWLSNDVKIRIRVKKPYAPYYSVPFTDSTYNDTIYNNNPIYTFSTEGISTLTNDVEKAKTDLDLIRVVPNPYYGYSEYETNQLDNRIKITNLPRKCTISIYNTSGTLIRQFFKDEIKTSIDWDLKNYAGIPIAGGVYIIHVKADGVGEKIVKWLGVLRPIDLNAF